MVSNSKIKFISLLTHVSIQIGMTLSSVNTKQDIRVMFLFFCPYNESQMGLKQHWMNQHSFG